MKSKKYSFIVVNSFNMITVLIVLISTLLLKTPAINYLHAKLALLSRLWALGAIAANCIFYFAYLITSICKPSKRIVTVIAFTLSLVITYFGFHDYYPWARLIVFRPSVQSIVWREDSLSELSDNLKSFARENNNIIPTDDNWKQKFVQQGYDYENIIDTWHQNFDSTILINENLKGIPQEKLYDLDDMTVVLFEGPKAQSFGNKETFKQFAEKNRYVYVITASGVSGRVDLHKNKMESLFYNTKYLSLKWSIDNQNIVNE